MIQNSTIYQDSQEASRRVQNIQDYITFGHHDSPILQFENELDQNLDDIGTSRKDLPLGQFQNNKSKTKQYVNIEENQITFFISQCFKKQSQIKCQNFVKQSLKFFLPNQKYTDKQFSYITTKIKKILATSNPDYISLNALRILNKQHSFRIILLQFYLQGKYRIKHKQLDSQNTKILQQLSKLQKQISIQQSTFAKRLKQIEKKQLIMNQKQKQLVSRQKDFKAIISKQYQKLQFKLTKIYSQKTQDLDKKSSNIQKGLKYKIQILDKKLDQLNSLKQSEKISNDKIKQKLTKIQKQNLALKTKIKQSENLFQTSLFQAQQKTQKLTLFEQKISKLQKKVAGLKDQNKIKQTEIQNLSQLVSLKQQQSKLQNEYHEKQIKQTKKNLKVNKNKHQSLNYFILFSFEFIQTINNCSMNLINTYINDPQKHLSLPEIVFPKAESLIKSFYTCFSHIINENTEISFNRQTISIVQKMIQIVFFSHKYIRIQKSQNILDKVFENNKLKDSGNKLTQYYIVDDDLSTKIIKQIQILLKTCQFSQTLTMGVFSFISASTLPNKSASLVIISEIISDSFELKQKLLKLDFLALFFDKIDKKQLQQVQPFLDIILQLITQQQLRQKLFQFMYVTEIYKQIWQLLLVLSDKTSIILQRFYYSYQQLKLQSHQLVILKNIKNTLDKQSLGYANLEAIQSYF